jgi:cytochrome c oxidase assembly protein subunit 15
MKRSPAEIVRRDQKSYAALRPIELSGLMTEFSNAPGTPYHRAYHIFTVLTASCVFLLIVAGALVTSNEAGLSVPDWPTSFGSLYRIPPLVGGVKFEHGHRMLAEFIGLLTIGVAVWTQKVDKRRWMRILGWCALGTVIAQGILGGLTVLFFLPPAISTMHATLAQTFFCIMVSIAFFTSRSWVQAAAAVIGADARPRLTTLAALTVTAVWLQLVMGAAFRHSGIRLLPHLIGACVVFAMVNWLAITTLKRHRGTQQLSTPATVLLILLALQITLGIASYVTRVLWSPGAAVPLASMVVATVAHVACGALVLVTTVILTIQIGRHIGAETTAETRAGCTNAVQAAEQRPSGAKAQILCGSYGTAEAVPFQKPVYATSSSPGAFHSPSGVGAVRT